MIVASSPRAFLYDRDLSVGLNGKYRSVYDKISAGSRVLEIGCSTGYFSEVLIRKNWKVIAVDSDLDAVSACMTRGIEAHHCDVASAEFENVLANHGPFDVVLAMDVLEHLPAPHVLVSALSRCMQPQSKLIVTGPNVAYWHTRWRLLLGRWDYTEAGIMDKTHLRWFTRATWHKLLTENGFNIVSEAVAESMYPKETQLRTVLGTKIIEAVKRIGDEYLPNRFATVFIFQCSPNPK